MPHIYDKELQVVVDRSFLPPLAVRSQGNRYRGCDDDPAAICALVGKGRGGGINFQSTAG